MKSVKGAIILLKKSEALENEIKRTVFYISEVRYENFGPVERHMFIIFTLKTALCCPSFFNWSAPSCHFFGQRL